mgnify:CR=1 FL=1
MPDITMGIVDVARLAATAATVAIATITSTLSATSSAASVGSNSGRSLANRYSLIRFLPSTQPNLLSPSTSAVRSRVQSEEVRKWHEHAHPIDFPALC